MDIRVGQGYDVHALVAGRKLILGGVTIPYELGLQGHSDADVLLHAITDAVLGAAGQGDIGRLFPDSDEQWRGADSRILLRGALAAVRAAGWRVGNIDCTVICQAPRIAPHAATMCANIAADLGIAAECVNVKGKTTERLGFEGRGEGIAASAVALLWRDQTMSPQPALISLVSVEEYIDGEQHSEIRHEYIDGQVYAMSGASRAHGLIVNALAFALTPAARRQHCQLFTSDMKLRLQIADRPVFYYPDLLLSCDPTDREAYFCSRPCLIVEVLSDTTERIDRREKLLAYQTLPSLQEYLLVAQDVRRVEIYRRATGWQAEYVTSGAVRLDCLEASVMLDDIYVDVDTVN